MESPVIDFITICDTPYNSDMQDPQAMIVLLQNDLVLIDLLKPGFPAFEIPHPLNLHEAAVTVCCYLADCPSDLVPAFYSAGRAASGNAAQARSELSDRDWPCNGGEWAPASCSYSEIIITGHADGSLKFWDASAGTLQVLYKLKTSKVFERAKTAREDSIGVDPLAIQLISLCPESRKLCVASAGGHVILFKFKKNESTSVTTVLDISNTADFSTEATENSPERESVGRSNTTTEGEKKETLQVKTGSQRKAPGFQSILVCQNAQTTISALTINSSYGLMVYGTESALVLIDIVHKLCLMHISVPAIYGSQELYSRAPRSPKKLDAPNSSQDIPQARSPSIDQNQSGTEYAEEALVSLMATPPNQEETGDFAPGTPEPIQGRRRSVAWKAFNLKRQLSRVDVKIKNTFSASQQTSQKRGSIFYYNSSPEEDEETTTGRTILSDTDEEGDVVRSATESNDASSGLRKTALRPDNLPLSTEGRKHCGFDIKRDDRFLSVPNMKYKSDAKNLQTHDGDSKQIQPSFAEHFMRRLSRVDKMDSSFSRSRSSSMSSLENMSTESVQCLAFCDCYLRKDSLTPTLWVGTSIGSVFTICLTIPDMENRRTQQASATIAGGGPFRLNGGITTISFLDYTGALIVPPSEPWRDEGKERRDKTPTRASRMSPTLASDTLVFNTEQFVILVSEKQARVVSLPSQTCTYRTQIADGEFVVKAEVIVLRDLPCLISYLSSGHLTAHSLPSLRPLIDIDFLPLSELRIAKTFCFSNRGHGLYLTSPSELQKFTVCAEFCTQLPEMMCELFVATDMPEPPKESFFKGLFGGGPRPLDREELFGESSGKANRSVARVIQPGNSSTAIQDLGQRATSASSEVNRAHQLMMERGDKLSQLEDRAERMHNQAQDFSSSAHNLMLKYKDKKWYHL
ncbi:syntaxin-binding protein 5 isoform X3 [Ctenocephalides felis]|uniref:syntaxin-binding protein 5 isoform X3 n=1 Tax=Ctenocephalides felis TaxID=7515 RepID=UPI000E6E4B8A|nr:syntaxin-binding protein 5 isoform X3 [Ctenocephalides felis]